MQLSAATRKAIADALKTAFATTRLKLSKAEVVPVPNTVIGDFTEADFGGYAAVVIATALEFLDDGTGDWVIAPNAVGSFIADNTIAAPQTVYAWYITNAAGSALVACGALDAPFTFNQEGDGFVLSGISARIALDAVS